MQSEPERPDRRSVRLLAGPSGNKLCIARIDTYRRKPLDLRRLQSSSKAVRIIGAVIAQFLRVRREREQATGILKDPAQTEEARRVKM